MWEIVKKRVLELLEEDITLKNKPKTLEHIASGILPTYKFSIEFVKKYVIEVIRQNEGILHELSPVTLSSISKALYIYELEKET